ncbi:MAG TPA: DinB family protein [Thermoanaerobaculia bacterium]|jgi:uncharacterized damage-inducible protein DinB
MNELVSYIDRIRERTMRVVACVPPDRIEWTYKEGKFTFGDVMRHLASIERWMFVENAILRPSRYPGHGPDLADGYDNVVAYMKQMHAESMELLSTLTDADLTRKCMTPGGAELAAGKWLRAMIEHESHHRGQLYMYCGLLEIATPPIFGLTEEQVRERSAI